MGEYRPQPFETRQLTVVAQDPSIKRGSRILTTELTIPAESLDPGPRGARIHVIDYDTNAGKLYRPRSSDLGADVLPDDWRNSDITDNPIFHAQNVYAISMATLFKFESSLGRHIAWQFSRNAHQLKIAPHAFLDGNAFYSRSDQCLAFGYFRGSRNQWVHTCLSHDIVVHETTHALVDGIRPFFDRPSSPDQAAFHEGFADIIAILSVLQSPEIVSLSLGKDAQGYPGLLESSRIGFEALRTNALLRLAKEIGAELSGIRHRSLRASLDLPPGNYLADEDRQHPHTRGEILVAAVLRAYLKVWVARLEPIIGVKSRLASRERVVEEGTKAAKHLLTMAIRALDYLPPTDLTFPDYLSALITSDVETYLTDEPYHYRQTLIGSFADYGIAPASGQGAHRGQWEAPRTRPLYGFSHAEPMRSDTEAVQRFVWENRRLFQINPDAFTRVLSVRPVTRTGHDGFVVRETVAEVIQTLSVRADELKRLKIRKPPDMPDDTAIRIYGSNALVFDEFGQLKYDIGTSIQSAHQSDRLETLWNRGHYVHGGRAAGSFAELHRVAAEQVVPPEESW
ncbi:gluzincin family metallopeptidase [Lentisalinibacter salinarum]|uniref:hypothetical protein n=1 Tax=Lentisalinibacter salinarum TaxID=2992239 RepID=UPI00386A2FDA